MGKFERLLVPGSDEAPDCPCGAVMQFARAAKAENSADVEVRVFECATCGHEFRIAVWADAEDPAAVLGGF
jgi:hypothetical protein